MSRKWSIWSLDRVWDRKSFSGRLHSSTHSLCAFQVAHWVKESAWNARNTGRHKFDPWVGKMPWGRKWQSHSSVLAWEIPWTEEPGGLQSMGLHRVRNNWSNVHTHTFSLLLRTNSIFLEEPTVSHAQLTGFMEADLTPLLEQCASTWWESRRADPKTSAKASKEEAVSELGLLEEQTWNWAGSTVHVGITPESLPETEPQRRK